MDLKIEIDGKIMEATMKVVGDTMLVSPKEVEFDVSMFKDGDVITFGHHKDGGYSWTCILRGEIKITPDKIIIKDYCCINCDGCVYLKPDVSNIANYVRFATEEEKKELFDKLAEEGYEWNPDTKELVKLKWKPSMYDPYYIPFYETCEFIPMGTNWNGRNKDYIRYNKGLCFKTEEECQEFCNRLNQAIEGVKP